MYAVSLINKNGKEVTCQEDSSNQTNDGSASNVFYIDTKNVLDALTPTSNTLTVCCKMWQEELNTEGLRICSELIEVSHLWTAENFKSYSFFSDTFIERNIRFFLTFDRKDESRQYTLIIGAAPINNDDTLNFVVYDNSIKDGGGKIESSLLLIFRFATRVEVKFVFSAKPNQTVHFRSICTVQSQFTRLQIPFIESTGQSKKDKSANGASYIYCGDFLNCDFPSQLCAHIMKICNSSFQVVVLS
ncbi:hypothetical protein JTE90_029138 [Oedothorax gibbosus]|uniref:Uncharacterized protein n=1 Tax=Oedothorax gibbosus TaxID=931172 RepID=A0AAV6UJT8_9ARAC|nr:hypothetical protein JTE90_029138 [Oedothorax gibbosus]